MPGHSNSAFTFAPGSQYDPQHPTARRRGTAERDPYTNRLTGREVNHLGGPMGSSIPGDGSTLGGVTPIVRTGTPQSNWDRAFPRLPDGSPRPAPSPATAAPAAGVPQPPATSHPMFDRSNWVGAQAGAGSVGAPAQTAPAAAVAAASNAAADWRTPPTPAARAAGVPRQDPTIRAPADGSRANFRTPYGPVAVAGKRTVPLIPPSAIPPAQAPNPAMPSRTAMLTGQPAIAGAPAPSPFGSPPTLVERMKFAAARSGAGAGASASPLKPLTPAAAPQMPPRAAPALAAVKQPMKKPLGAY